MRLDIFLMEKNIFQSRERAKKAVQEGAVCVNDIAVTKPSYDVSETDDIKIVKETNPYVGRGGLKLEEAINKFRLELDGMKVLDVGASTGGFTDCMLKNGVSFVCACDVGHDQLAEVLRGDKRVISLEQTDIRDLCASPEKYGINFKFDFAAADVSFISVTKILPYIRSLLSPNAKVVCLIKPQFETESKKVGKKGVIRDPKVHKKICENVRNFAQSIGYEVLEIIDSPITGGDGNKEFLMLAGLKF